MADDKKFEIVGGGAIVTTVGKTVQVKNEFEKDLDSLTAPGLGPAETLADMYDRFSRLLYVIDASGSMGDGMLSEDSFKNYKWPKDLMAQFRERMKADEGLWDDEDEDESDYFGDEEDFDLDEEDDDPDEDEEPEQLDVDSLGDDEVKMLILRENLSARYGIPLEMNYSYRGKSRSKMMALKDAAKDFVHQRFQRVPDAKVAVFQFETSPQLLCAAGASETEVLAAINRLPDGGGGGTNIYSAVERAISECKQRPSEVGLHHIVLVSDGCDYGGIRVRDFLPRMKELGIVFDFIYMVGLGEDATADQVAKVMQEVCEATGGEYTVVKTEQDFEQKFLEVSNRPLLPPAR